LEIRIRTEIIERVSGHRARDVLGNGTKARWAALQKEFPTLVSSSLWNRDTCRTYLHFLVEELEIRRTNEWYDISSKGVSRIPGARRFLATFGGSLQTALEELLSGYPWQPWRFVHVCRNYWSLEENRQAYVHWLEKEFGIVRLCEWYTVRVEAIRQRGGSRFLQWFGGSMQRALQTFYPNYDWKPWLFTHPEKSFWNSESSVQRFLEWFEHKFLIIETEDWYDISQRHLRYFGGRPLLNSPASFQQQNHHHHRQEKSSTKSERDLMRDHKAFSNLASHLQVRYPEHRWDVRRFLSRAVLSKTQRLIFRMLREFFTGFTVSLDRPFLNDLCYVHSGVPISFDVFVLEFSLAVEYHGAQHYHSSDFFGTAIVQRRLDLARRVSCLSAGITLIEIGYWWNFERSSLLAAIARQRPDLIPKDFLEEKEKTEETLKI